MSDQKLGHQSDFFKTLLPSRGHSFTSIFMKLHQNVCLDDILAKFKYGSCQIKIRSIVQIYPKPCSPSRDHTFAKIFINFDQNVSLGDI